MSYGGCRCSPLRSLPSPPQRGRGGGRGEVGGREGLNSFSPARCLFPLAHSPGARRARSVGPWPRRRGALGRGRVAGGADQAEGGSPVRPPAGLTGPSAVGGWGEPRGGRLRDGQQLPGLERGSAAVKTRAGLGGLCPCLGWSQAVAPV